MNMFMHIYIPYLHTLYTLYVIYLIKHILTIYSTKTAIGYLDILHVLKLLHI